MQGRKGANSFSVSTHSTTKRITFRTIVLCIFASFWPDGCFADCYSRFLSFWPLQPPPIKKLYLIVVCYPNYYKWTTGCSGKLCFFLYSLQLLLRLHRCKRSSQRNANVQSLLLAGYFFLQPIAADCWRGRGGKLSRILGKKHNILWT